MVGCPIPKTKVDALKSGQQIWDANVTGFGVVANRNSKSFKLKYRFNGQQRMFTIGAYGSPYTVETARKEATKLLGLVKSGTDPSLKFATGGGKTVAEFSDLYLQKHAHPNKKASSAAQDEMNIKNHVKPPLGKKLVAAITSEDIENFKADVQRGKSAPADPAMVQKEQKGGAPVSGGKGVANRCLALMSKMFNLAELWGERDKGTNPVRGVAKFKENQLERYLTEDETSRLWSHLSDLETQADADTASVKVVAHSIHAIVAIKLLLLTGARKMRCSA